MSTNSQAVARFVTVMMGLVIGLTFLFGFGNVLNLALKLQVPVFVAPLVAPAVDLTVLGLLVGTRHLALSGASDDVLRPARRLLLAASVVTLLLNVADPVCAGQWGKAAFDAVGPLLLIGWAEAGPGLLCALNAANADPGTVESFLHSHAVLRDGRVKQEAPDPRGPQPDREPGVVIRRADDLDEELVERARRADAEHWRRYRRPISAETLRKQLRVGATTSRALVRVVRPKYASVDLSVT
ncbi:hypothetical protein [Amycolatopsis keratiniphila]|uniref:hypothetical protein n=1 Tax=Amycolatopsis keratiniphila TaxID=129921 RepID=UPI00087D5046|nr:hypothetical protein [Amycolatopsis keratiniphila]OLZ60703.1 hypothetical protein BS330_03500 [Amycolatopsis keratiniphila subsp. nogabecina]SDU66169.1 hypothetical protein SAMN04489733_7889 [Amycolatopsis keratiniphila]